MAGSPFGFFSTREESRKKETVHRGPLPTERLRELGCKACPLNTAQVTTPKMLPTGSATPLLYVLGEAPSKTEDETPDENVPKFGKHQVRQFLGKAGERFRSEVPPELRSKIRWNNVINDRPPGNRTPAPVEVECFPASTKVASVGRIKMLYRRRYDGPLVTLETAGGNLLTGTPNHPVFTSRGKLPIHEVKVGDHLIRASWGDGVPLGRAPNREKKPTSIGEIFSAFAERAEVDRIRSGTLDFHGDGKEGEVEVIWTDGLLLDEGQASLFQKVEEPCFLNSNSALGSLVGDCSVGGNRGVLPSTDTGSALLRRMRVKPGLVSLSDGPDFYPAAKQRHPDGFIVSPLRFCDAVETFPSEVSGGYVAGERLEVLPPFLDLDFPFNEVFSQCCGVNFEQLRDLLQRFPFGVEFDEVVSIKTKVDSLHVYNLETESGAYLAEGLLVSNCCRSRIEADIIESKPKAVLALGGMAAGWFGATGGINLWRGRRFPFALGGHKFWVFPTFHPSFVIRTEGMERGQRSQGDAEKAALFPRDLTAVWAALEDLPEPKVLEEADLLKQVSYFHGGGNEELAKLRKALDELSLEAPAIDVETHGLRPYARDAKLLSLAISDGKKTVAVGVDHPGAKWKDKKALKQVIVDFLRKAKTRVAHRSLYDLEWLVHWFAEVDEEAILFLRWDDTQAQAYVLDGNKGALSLDVRMLLYFGLRIKGLSDVDRANLIKFPLQTVLRYNAIDAEGTALLFIDQGHDLKRCDQHKVYRFHMKRIPALVLAQRRGVHVDQPQVQAFRVDYSKQIAVKMKEISAAPEVVAYGRAYGPLNPGSPKQLSVLFRDMLKRPEGVRGSSYSTDEVALTAMANSGVHIATAMLELRSLNKLKGTYLDPLVLGGQNSIVYPDGCVHTVYSDTGTDTSRLSSDAPNLQNFPSREHKEIRNVIAARPGRVLLAIDYGQIEARVIGIMSKDASFCKALHERYDVHLEWAQRLAKAYPPLLDRCGGNMKALRSLVKNKFVFPAFYLAGERSIAGYLEMPFEKLAPEFKVFWKVFSGVKEWQNQLVAFYNEHGYVESLTGRRRYAPLSMSAICNTPIQSAASDIVIDAMQRMALRAHEEDDDNILPRLNIHDDITCEPEMQHLERTLEKVVPMMLQTPFDWVSVPLSIEVSVGKSWGALKPLDTFYSDELSA